MTASIGEEGFQVRILGHLPSGNGSGRKERIVHRVNQQGRASNVREVGFAGGSSVVVGRVQKVVQRRGPELVESPQGADLEQSFDVDVLP